jgi:hypothetical protein
MAQRRGDSALKTACRHLPELLGKVLLLTLGLAGLAPAAVDDSIVQDVRVTGNKRVQTPQILASLSLHAGAPLSRAAVIADASRIEALYKTLDIPVAVSSDLTHPGEHQGAPRATLTFNVEEQARRASAVTEDPLEAYYDNTAVCAAAQTGNDLCHLWLNRDGSMIIFDPGEAKTGHYSVGPMRADGKVPVCLHWDSPAMVSPAEVRPRIGPPPPPVGPSTVAGAPAAGVSICRNDKFRTTCSFNVDPATLSDEERKETNLSMGERFYRGMCYPLGPHYVGDVWFEADDPLPGQLGMDKMLLVPGRR